MTINYTTTYINQVLTAGYCCIGSLGDKVNIGLNTGLDYKHTEMQLRRAFLYVFALRDWKQNDDGSIPDPDNSITQQDMNNLVECIIKNCGCVPDGIDNITPVILPDGYWEGDYSDSDYVE